MPPALLFALGTIAEPTLYQHNPFTYNSIPMDDLFKKFLYTGVGLASLTAEKLQETIDDLVGRGKLSQNEGKKILDDFFSNTDAKKEEFEAKLREAAESAMERFSMPTKEDVTALNQRIAELEKQIELMRQDQDAGDKPKK